MDRHFLNIDYESYITSLPYFSSVSLPAINVVGSNNATVTYRVTEQKINRADIGIEELEQNQGLACFQN